MNEWMLWGKMGQREDFFPSVGPNMVEQFKFKEFFKDEEEWGCQGKIVVFGPISREQARSFWQKILEM